MKAGQALDVHGLLLEVLETSEPARDLVRTIADRQGQISGDVAQVIVNHLRAGETFHVADEVSALVNKREAALPEIAQFGHFTPPTPCGMIVLERPVETSDKVDYLVVSHMITWGPARFQGTAGDTLTGTCIVLWHDDRRAGSREKLADSLGATNTLSLDPKGWRDLMAETAGLLPVVVMAATSLVRLGPRKITYPEQPGTKPVRSPLRLLCALWQLMDETVTVVRDEPKFGSAHRHRAVRRGHRPRVTVVTLRRTSYKGVEGARGPLTERHDVRGHWRKYWVGSGAERHQERRWVELHESPKNPNLPKASATRKVYDLRR